jgi:hypothetical protein
MAQPILALKTGFLAAPISIFRMRAAGRRPAWLEDPFTFAPQGGESGVMVMARDPVRARLMLFNDVSQYIDQPPYSENRLSNWFDSTQ